MACSRESAEKDTKLESEIKEEFLSCKICYEPFTNPKSLSCLHTFCEKCLEAHLATIRTYKYSDHKEFPCPMCRKRTTLPSGGVRALPDNFLIGSLNELVGRQRVTKLPFCEVCKLVNKKVQEAKSKCIECNKLMCKTCVDKHAQTKITASHNMFDIDIEKDIGCKIHPEEMVKYFCENCETCVCVLCTFQEHADHELLSFQEGVTKYRGDMYRLLNKCKSMINGYTKIAEALQKTEDIIKITEKEIKDTSHAFVAAIRAKEKQMIDELHNVYGEEVMEFIAKRADIDLTLNNLSSTTRLADVIMKGSPMEMLLLKKDVSDKLEDLAELCPPALPEQINKKVMFIQGSVLLGSLESGAASKTLTAFMDKRPRNREVQTDPIWIHDLTDDDGEPVAASIKVKYVERYQEETQTDLIETQHMWSQTKDDLEMDDVWCQTGEDDFGFFDDQALWYYNEKQWYQKELEDESVQTEPLEEEKSHKNFFGENDFRNIFNNKLNSSDKPKPTMVDTGTQVQEAKKSCEGKGVQTMIIGQPLKSQPLHKDIQVALVGDPLGSKPKQFVDKFSQSERHILKDSQVQVTEVGDPLWVTPKDFRDACVQKDMDPQDWPGNVQPPRDGSSVAPPQQEPREKENQVTSAKTLKLEIKQEVKTTESSALGNQDQAKITQPSKTDIPQSPQSPNSGGFWGANNQPTPTSHPAKVEATSQPKQQKQSSSTSNKPSQKEPKRVIKPQSPQVTSGKQESNVTSVTETREPLSEAEAFKKAREEMVQAAKTLLDPAVAEAANIELERHGSNPNETQESNISSVSSLPSTQEQTSQVSQANNSSSLGPMQAYGPINIPPGTMIRRVQNLPAGAVPIDPSMLPPGMIPMHVKANPNASQGMPKAETVEHGKPRRISDDSGRASKLVAPIMAYPEEDSVFMDEDMGKFSRDNSSRAMEKMRTGRRNSILEHRRSSPPRVYRRTVSSASTGRQSFIVEPLKSSFAITASSAATATNNTPSASITTAAPEQQKTRARQPMKRRTQRSHTDQLFARETAAIAPIEFGDDEELEAESESLVQALTLPNSPRSKAANDLEATRTKGSKTLLRAKGLSKEKGLDKKKSRSRTTSCSQQ